MIRTFSLSLGLLLGACATAPTVVEPSWARRPDAEALGRAYPAFAALIGQRGVATLRCGGAAEGALTDCRVEHVSPQGLGFDRAALALTPEFRLNPRLEDGLPARSDVRFHLNFVLDEGPRPAWTEAEPSPDEIALARRVAERSMPPPQAAVRRLDVDAEREAWVRALVIEAETELRPRRREALALSMARILDPATLEMLTVGQRRPPPPDPARLEASLNGMDAVENALTQRLRATYCSHYDCELRPR